MSERQDKDKVQKEYQEILDAEVEIPTEGNKGKLDVVWEVLSTTTFEFGGPLAEEYNHWVEAFEKLYHKESNELIVDGLFVEIGAVPNVELAQSLGVKLDERGYIKADNMMRTNVDGVFAAGDTVNHFGKWPACPSIHYRQALTAYHRIILINPVS